MDRDPPPLPLPLALRTGAALAIRHPGPNDAEALLAYLDQVRKETDFLLWQADEPLPTVEAERAWLRTMTGPDAHQLLVENAGKPVAIGSVRRLGPHRVVAHRATLGISVIRNFWGRGVGEALTRRLLAWAKAHPHIRQVELGVFEDNHRARQLYARCGFQETGRTPDAIQRREGAFTGEISMSCRVG